MSGKEILLPRVGLGATDTGLARLAHAVRAQRKETEAAATSAGSANVHLERITIAPTPATVTLRHGLGRMPTGWYLTTCDTPPMVFETSRTAEVLVLANGSASAIVLSVMVF